MLSEVPGYKLSGIRLCVHLIVCEWGSLSNIVCEQILRAIELLGIGMGNFKTSVFYFIINIIFLYFTKYHTSHRYQISDTVYQIRHPKSDISLLSNLRLRTTSASSSGRCTSLRAEIRPCRAPRPRHYRSRASAHRSPPSRAQGSAESSPHGIPTR